MTPSSRQLGGLHVTALSEKAHFKGDGGVSICECGLLGTATFPGLFRIVHHEHNFF